MVYARTDGRFQNWCHMLRWSRNAVLYFGYKVINHQANPLLLMASHFVSTFVKLLPHSKWLALKSFALPHALIKISNAMINGKPSNRFAVDIFDQLSCSQTDFAIHLKNFFLNVHLDPFFVHIWHADIEKAPLFFVILCWGVSLLALWPNSTAIEKTIRPIILWNEVACFAIKKMLRCFNFSRRQNKSRTDSQSILFAHKIQWSNAE